MCVCVCVWTWISDSHTNPLPRKRVLPLPKSGYSHGPTPPKAGTPTPEKRVPTRLPLPKSGYPCPTLRLLGVFSSLFRCSTGPCFALHRSCLTHFLTRFLFPAPIGLDRSVVLCTNIWDHGLDHVWDLPQRSCRYQFCRVSNRSHTRKAGNSRKADTPTPEKRATPEKRLLPLPQAILVQV